jgi:myo-inositol-1(or 4)-monophosphatase
MPVRPGAHAHFAVRVAREAALMIRTLARPRRVRRLKSSAYDILTSTDLRVEAHVRRRIHGAYPDHAVVGEEGVGEPDGGGGAGRELDLSRPTWFVDPVDGTTNYFRGMPLVACNIAFWDGERLRCGASADVYRMRTYWAEHTRGAWLGRRRLRVTDTRQLSRAVLSTGFPSYRASVADNNLAEFAALVTEVRDVRRIGAAGLDLAWLASGLLDGYWEQGDGPWDWAVGALLVREAGGRVTTYDGRDWVPGDPALVASNGRLHAELLSRIGAARAGLGAPRAE